MLVQVPLEVPLSPLMILIGLQAGGLVLQPCEQSLDVCLWRGGR